MTPRLVSVGSRTTRTRRAQHSRNVLPVQFSVNSESRECALRHYNLRFTISLTVSRKPFHALSSWDCVLWEGVRHNANVVMSFDDTLRIFGSEGWRLKRNHVWKCRISNANMASPWNSQSQWTSIGGQPELKRVARLGPDFTSHARILNDLNSTVSWNLDSMLDKKYARVRKLASSGGPREETYLKGHVLRLHAKFLHNLKEGSQRLVPVREGGPDVRIFELRWEL